MSFDLTFKPRQGDAIPLAAIQEHFRGRPNFKVTRKSAAYFNEATGVSFVFVFDEQPLLASARAKKKTRPVPVTFNVNFFRPRPFILEAEPEVRAFLEAFELEPDEGLNGRAFSSEALVSAWEIGNEAGYRVAFSADARRAFEGRPRLPAARIEPLWRWNHERDARVQRHAERLYVPLILFLRRGSEPLTLVLHWTPSIPTLLPQTDLVAIGRGQGNQVKVVERAKLAAQLRRHPEVRGEPLPCLAVPADDEDAIFDRVPESELAASVSALPFEEILEAEIVERCVGARA